MTQSPHLRSRKGKDIMSAGCLVFSVGHSDHPLDVFVGLLRMHDIHLVADIRSQPYSAHAPQYNIGSLRRRLGEAGFQYVYLGDELGGRPRDARFYDPTGRVMYSLVARSPDFLRGINDLEEAARKLRVAMLCSEENPSVCHRHLLVGRVLSERGGRILHIRRDGRLQTGEELTPLSGGQTGLFNESEDVEWKSIRSVSLGRQQRNSSKR